MRCSTCGKDVENIRYCSFCNKPICIDCVRYVVVKRKTLHKEYEESIPVCKNCLPEVRFKRNLLRVVNEILSQIHDKSLKV